MIRKCADCQAPFSIEPEEEDWFRREGLSLPKRCPRCRAARRETRDEFRTCQRCGRTFRYPRELQLYARTYGWGPPRRCIGGCPGHDRSDETEQERVMRELLEGLRDRRQRQDAPPIEAVLDVQRRPRPAPPRGPDRDALFRGLDGDAPRADAEARLRAELEQEGARRRGPEDLFASLAAPAEGPREGKRDKRRPRPQRDRE